MRETAMRAIFLTNNKQTLPRVFTEVTRAELSTLIELDEKVYTDADLAAMASAFDDVEIVFSTWGIPELNEEQIRAYLPRLKCIFYGAGSVQRFARPYLACGVRVFSAWAANAVPVAELTAAQIVLANKGYFVTSRAYASKGRSAARDAFGNCNGNLGETVGIIGAGMIGRKVIELLRQYRLDVAVFDPFLSDKDAIKLGVNKCSLEELFERSMTVSNHLANNPETRNMITYDHFRRMRKCATFINTGRGAQVVQDDLLRILTERPDLTALLDVTTPEPLPEGHALLSMPNCIVTPHIAGSAGNELARMGEYMLDEFRLYVDGKPTRYEVTEKMLETMA
jgi:phosphoglycerate dehydrogenase-like enzyme